VSLVTAQEVDNVKRLQEEMRRTILDANNQIASVYHELPYTKCD